MLLKKLQLLILCNFFLLIFVNGKSSWKRKYNSKHAENREYDFIIVGAGPAGCILANRLSQNPQWKILLIEAGHFETSIMRVPLFATFFPQTSFSWHYQPEFESGTCLGYNDQRCNSPQGKGVGGGSVVNFQMYSRGHKKDFNRMKKRGNYGWSWDDVLPYFKKSERVQIPELKSSAYHGTNGDISVDYSPHRSVLAEAFVEASKSLGFNEVDYNSGHQVGVSYLQSNTLRGRRHSAFRAFIEPILERDNLDIMVATHVTKILIDNQKTAYGVECIRKDKKFTVTATKEVILSAGIFNSPQLLMLSGVGPASELNRIKVPVIHKLPVGQTMEYHSAILAVTFVTNTTGIAISPDTITSSTIREYSEHHKGWLTIPAGIEALTFANTRESTIDSEDVPDIELMISPTALHTDRGEGFRKALNMTSEIYDTVYKPLELANAEAFTITVQNLNMKSKGRVTLRDNNPFSAPLIYSNYFSKPQDMETFLRGIRLAVKIGKSQEFQKFGAKLHDIPLPGCTTEVFESDDYWKCVIRIFGGTIFHETSTCKMGQVSDPTTVVSPELKVHGINRLRVADTSTIPFVTTSHTGANSMLIGEKVAEMIKNDY